MTSATTDPVTEPAVTIQQQLDAYNAKDLEGLLTIYAENAQMFEYPATLAATGTAELRQRFAGRFQEPDLHAQLLKRIVMGHIVVDHELVTRTFAEGTGTIELTMIYEVQKGKIQRAWMIPGPKTVVAKA